MDLSFWGVGIKVIGLRSWVLSVYSWGMSEHKVSSGAMGIYEDCRGITGLTCVKVMSAWTWAAGP